MHHAGAGLGRGARDRLGTGDMHGSKALAAALEQDADQIDDDIGAVHRRGNRGRIADIRLHGMNLADAAERLQDSRSSSGRRTATRMR